KFSGTFVDCKLGNPTDFPSSVHGKIALIQRGTLTFLAKVTNALAAGATGVIIYDNKPPDPTFGGPGYTETNGSLPTLIPMVMLTQADGQALLATPNAVVTASFGLEGWELESGTSMATPHATGVVALAWSVAPTATANDVQNAVLNTATDLGAVGYDTVYGNGLVNALDAAKQLNPAPFGSGATPQPPTGRPPGRRGQ
ncbi:MAG TPA: PA domain-containing protein, partial [Thermoanaerobaculia bacterium]|nr:PA domain-containing protein [Thermoanaerobaculia bacterium]